MSKMPHSRRTFKKGTLKRLLQYMSPFRLQLIIVAIGIVVSAAATAASALFLQSLIDEQILPLVGVQNPDYSGLVQMIAFMASVYAIGILSAFVYNRLLVGVAQGTVKRVRDEMFTHMQSLPIGYFDTRASGDIMSLYTSDVDTLREVISQSLPQMTSSLITVIASFLAMLYLSIPLSALVIVFAFVLFKVISFIVGRSGKYFMKQQSALGDVNGYIEELVNGQKVVKVFNYEERAKRIFDEKNEQLFAAATQANQYGNITMPVVGNFGYLLYVVLAVVGGAAGIAQLPNISLQGMSVLTMGTIISFLTLSRSFINPIGQISMQFNMVVMALAGASRIFDLMDAEPEDQGGTVRLVNVREQNGALIECDSCSNRWAWKSERDGETVYTPLKGDIRFDQVDFGYTEEKTVLHDVTLFAKPGHKIAFVGATGAGKTTITNLINRFYDIKRGKITYDGIDIFDIHKEDLRRSLGVVLQDVNLFTGTVMDNIRYGKLDATDEECIAAAKLANAHGFIEMLPEGYQTVIEEDGGGGLSQGQRQLISIARAAVSNPPVMILDEATSSIDTRTESIVQEGMDALMKGRTVFVIAHRLSTIQNANVILLLEGGRIIERGTHEQLLELGGKYAALYETSNDLDEVEGM